MKRYQWNRNAEGGQTFGNRMEIRELDEKALSAMSKSSQATCCIFCGLFTIEFFSKKAVGLARQHYC